MIQLLMLGENIKVNGSMTYGIPSDSWDKCKYTVGIWIYITF